MNSTPARSKSVLDRVEIEWPERQNHPASNSITLFQEDVGLCVGGLTGRADYQERLRAHHSSPAQMGAVG
jgi:hypothetical protein